MAWDTVSRSERPPEQPVSSGQPAPPRSTGSFLDASSTFEGVIHSNEPLRLDGRVKGEIHCKDSVVIGESARIEATIRAEVVAVAGEVRGEVYAARKITLGATARMVGNLTTPAIAIEEGAELVGRAQIGKPPAKSALQPAPNAAPLEPPRENPPAKPSITPAPPTA
jgi:cytoskeletal protein CcmA (bactofilin family)